MSEVPKPRPRRTAPKRSAATGDTGATERPDFPRSDGAPIVDDAPPIADAPRARASEPRAARAPRAGALESKLQELFSAPALAFSLAGDDHCAEIIAKGAPQMARAWARLANENAAVRRLLNQLLEGSAWGGVIYSTLIVAMPIAAHHGAPVPLLGGLTKSAPAPSAGNSTFTWGSHSQTPAAESSPETVAPVAPVQPVDDTGSPSEGTPPVYVPGAPPGVVTVQNGPAQHPGAR